MEDVELDGTDLLFETRGEGLAVEDTVLGGVVPLVDRKALSDVPNDIGLEKDERVDKSSSDAATRGRQEVVG